MSKMRKKYEKSLLKSSRLNKTNKAIIKGQICTKKQKIVAKNKNIMQSTGRKGGFSVAHLPFSLNFVPCDHQSLDSV